MCERRGGKCRRRDGDGDVGASCIEALEARTDAFAPWCILGTMYTSSTAPHHAALQVWFENAIATESCSGVKTARPWPRPRPRSWRFVGAWSDALPSVQDPRQVAITDDGTLVVLGRAPERACVHVVTPDRRWLALVGQDELHLPQSVAANDAFLAVAEPSLHRVTIFGRASHAVVCRIRARHFPQDVCFCEPAVIAVAECADDGGVGVYSVCTGELLRRVGRMRCPVSVAVTAAGDLVVADRGRDSVAVFSAAHELLRTLPIERESKREREHEPEHEKENDLCIDETDMDAPPRGLAAVTVRQDGAILAYDLQTATCFVFRVTHTLPNPELAELDEC